MTAIAGPRSPVDPCPKCGARLTVDMTTMLTSIPPQCNAACGSCGWRGYVDAYRLVAPAETPAARAENIHARWGGLLGRLSDATAPLDFDAIEAEALGVSEELSARVEMKDPSLLSRFHPAERERAALFFRGARATTLRLVERIRELEASLARETATIVRLHETITGVTSLHARDLRRIADALDLNAADSWDADEITKLVRHERAARKSYEEGLAWETSCLHCASTLTSCREAEERAEAAEAIIAGRLSAPTDAEIAAHEAAGGWWYGTDRVGRPFLCTTPAMARTCAVTDVDRRWWALDADGCPCAWPMVAETAK